MKGRRIYPGPDGYIPDAEIMAGDYWFADGSWAGKVPSGHRCGLRNHQITEHEDGTITVSPSIRVLTGTDKEAWHGYLEHGIWREC